MPNYYNSNLALVRTTLEKDQTGLYVKFNANLRILADEINLELDNLVIITRKTIKFANLVITDKL